MMDMYVWLGALAALIGTLQYFEQIRFFVAEETGVTYTSNNTQKLEYTLDNARKIEPFLPGPESFAEDENGRVYTGLADGRVVRLDNLRSSNISVTTLGYTGEPDESTQRRCGALSLEPVCGRPLGMLMYNARTLIVCDAYIGVLKFDTHTYEKHVLVQYVNDSDTNTQQKIKFCNSITADLPNNKLYFTVSSTLYARNQVFWEIAHAAATGYVAEYDMEQDTTNIIGRNFRFANGITLTHNGAGLLVVEFSTSKIHRYDFESQKWSEFANAQTLGFSPDNIHRHPKKHTYTLGGCVKHTQQYADFMNSRFKRSLLGAFPYNALLLMAKLGYFGGTPIVVVGEIDEEGQLVHKYTQTAEKGEILLTSEGKVLENGDLLIGSFDKQTPLFILEHENLSD